MRSLETNRAVGRLVERQNEYFLVYDVEDWIDGERTLIFRFANYQVIERTVFATYEPN